MKSIFLFRLVIGALFIAQYFVGIDGHGRGAGNLFCLLLGIVFFGYGLVTWGQYNRAVKRSQNGQAWCGIPSRWSPAGIFLIVIGILWGAEYFFGFDGRGHGTGNVMSLLFGAAFIAWGGAVIANLGSSAKSPAALCRRGLMHERGEGVPQDYAEAEKLYRQAAEKGYAPAQYNLGLLHLKGLGMKQDDSEALSWFRKAADQGYVRAQFNTGVLYANGFGIEKNYPEALKYYTLAAEKEYPPAINNLGDLYEHGFGVPQDYMKALELYRKAADKGWCNAYIGLGDLYSNGYGVDRDISEAYFWYSLAATITTDDVTKKTANERATAIENKLNSSQLETAQKRVEEEKPRRVHLNAMLQGWS